MTSPRERAALRLCRFHPCCEAACEECLGAVDAVLDEIREPGVPALDNMLFSLRPYCDPMIAAADAWQAVIDAIKRGEG